MKDTMKKTYIEELEKRFGVRKGASFDDNPETTFYIPEPAPMPVVSEMDTSGFALAFGYKPSLNVEVKVYNDTDWDEEDRVFIPSKDKFKDYMPNRQVLEDLALAIDMGLKTLIVGPTGSGKTSIQEYFCAMTRQPYYRINGRQDMETDTLLGKPWVSDGSMHFELGELPKALKKGWFITFDEPWKTPSGIQMALQRYYERDGILQIDDMPGELGDKQVIPDPRARMVLSDNVVGTGDNVDMYGATLIQDSSTLNRMDVVLKMDYMTQTDEVQMLRNKYKGLHDNDAKKLVQLSTLLRKSYEQRNLSVACSPRNLFSIVELFLRTGDIKYALRTVLMNRYSSDEEQSLFRDHVKTVYARDI